MAYMDSSSKKINVHPWQNGCRRLEETNVPEWMTTRKTILIEKDPPQ